jgi:hypothetical protein
MLCHAPLLLTSLWHDEPQSHEWDLKRKKNTKLLVNLKEKTHENPCVGVKTSAKLFSNLVSSQENVPYFLR